MLLTVLYVVVLLAVIATVITGIVLIARDMLTARASGQPWDTALPRLLSWRFAACVAIAVGVGLLGAALGRPILWVGVLAAGLESAFAAELGHYCLRRLAKPGWWQWAWVAALPAAAVLALRAIG